MPTKTYWQPAEIEQVEQFLRANNAVLEFSLKVRGKVLLLEHLAEDSIGFSTDLRITREADGIFLVERYCYRGSIDDWIPLGGVTLQNTNNYIQHLGHLSFFDLV